MSWRSDRIKGLTNDLTCETLEEIAERIIDLDDRIEELEANLSSAERERDEALAQVVS